MAASLWRRWGSESAKSSCMSTVTSLWMTKLKTSMHHIDFSLVDPDPPRLPFAHTTCWARPCLCAGPCSDATTRWTSPASMHALHGVQGLHCRHPNSASSTAYTDHAVCAGMTKSSLPSSPRRLEMEIALKLTSYLKQWYIERRTLRTLPCSRCLRYHNPWHQLQLFCHWMLRFLHLLPKIIVIPIARSCFTIGINTLMRWS